MHQMKPELQNYLVEKILKETLQEKPKQKREFKELVHLCQTLSLESSNVKKMALRLMRMEANRILVRSFLSSLTQEEQTFLRLKYKDERELINISLQLHVSISQLSIWSNRLIDSLANYMNFELTDTDIYKQKKIINMIEALASTLKCVRAIDPDHAVVDVFWFQSIEQRYNSYRKLLNRIEDVVRHHNINMKTNVVYLQIQRPNASKAEIANECKIDKGTVSRYLINFKESVYPFLRK